MRQMLLNLPVRTDYSAGAFALTAGSAAARAAIEALVPSGKIHTGETVVVVGPPASGKSHLLTIWKTRMDGNQLAVAVDDLQALDKSQQENLFHTYNTLKEKGGALLITSTRPATELPLLPDLQSRLATAKHVILAPPDDTELAQLIAEWAADRQLVIPAGVVDYALARTERSPAVLRALIEALDALSLEHKRAITVPLVRGLIER